ncbi:ABC transporter substrate-binding protein [Streptomyces sp. NRRL F-5123]|uniref:ABC transporter substrate-binding protein n=1 Tax=Streptomyces sp. NRRL F-5123 TaxID=1463856 RepID=UPI0004E11B43|nr:sugar ABC transporter substrate-binding protein [Streptomyces sp. NRRL F-5123]
MALITRRALIAWAAAVLAAAGLTGCAARSASPAHTLTYWASNQAPSPELDRKVLRPELDKFQRRTGLHVALEVVPWADLLNRILAAAVSGHGPDVVNIGNTWSASLQATEALVPFDRATLAAVGGSGHFLATSMASTGAPGKPPAAVPLYGQAYGLYYNKRLLAGAGLRPPATWEELVADGRRLTDARRGRYGLSVVGASYTEGSHFAFIFGRQHGADPFVHGKPRFDSPGMVAGVRQYTDLVARDRIVNPSSVEFATDTPFVADFTSGKAAMIMAQSNADSAIRANGMKPEDYGVEPIPLPDPLPRGGQRINSHVAGTNIAVLTGTGDRDGSLSLVRFLTSAPEQRILNKAFGTLPVTTDDYSDPAFNTPAARTFRYVLAHTSAPMPMVPDEAQFETLVGNAVAALLADAGSGGAVGQAQVKAKLSEAQSQMEGLG